MRVRRELNVATDATHGSKNTFYSEQHPLASLLFKDERPLDAV